MNSENLIKFSIHNLLKTGLGIVILIFSIYPVFSQNNNSPFIYVLGNVQDAGLPHIGCNEEICINAYNENNKYYTTSIALVDIQNQEYSLFDVTPDISDQLRIIENHIFNKFLLPKDIFITHAHIGHYAGLMYFGREALGSKGVKVNVLPRMYDFINLNGPWSQLVNLENIALNKISFRETIEIRPNLSVVSIKVPHRDEYSETVGFIIKGKSKKALYIPDIDKWNKWNISIVEMIKKVDFAFLDGTFYDSNQINNRDISEIPHPFIIESLDLFKTLSKAEKDKIYFIHLNHTNPVLNKNSKAKYLYNNIYKS